MTEGVRAREDKKKLISMVCTITQSTDIFLKLGFGSRHKNTIAHTTNDNESAMVNCVYKSYNVKKCNDKRDDPDEKLLTKDGNSDLIQSMHIQFNSSAKSDFYAFLYCI